MCSLLEEEFIQKKAGAVVGVEEKKLSGKVRQEKKNNRMVLKVQESKTGGLFFNLFWQKAASSDPAKDEKSEESFDLIILF